MGKSKERQDRMNTWLIGLHRQQKEQKNDEGEYQIKKKKMRKRRRIRKLKNTVS